MPKRTLSQASSIEIPYGGPQESQIEKTDPQAARPQTLDPIEETLNILQNKIAALQLSFQAISKQDRARNSPKDPQTTSSDPAKTVPIVGLAAAVSAASDMTYKSQLSSMIDKAIAEGNRDITLEDMWVKWVEAKQYTEKEFPDLKGEQLRYEVELFFWISYWPHQAFPGNKI